MKVLVACEYSGRVRNAIAARGHDAWSCDFRETEKPGKHIVGDVRDILNDGWDAMIAHPYCTYNTLAGIRWMYHPDDTHLPPPLRRRHPKYPNRMEDFKEGISLFQDLQNAPIERIAIENSIPHGLMTAIVGNYTQLVQPWMHGSPYTKAACLWLKGFKRLQATTHKGNFDRIIAACHSEAPGPDRERNRSRTDPGIANAMAEQWFPNLRPAWK